MSEAREAEWEDRYGHLRANVPLRRTGYGWFIFAVLLIFALTLVDIIYLDEVLKWGLVAAYAVIFMWAFFLLFSRTRRGEAPAADDDGLLEFDVADSMDLEAEYLRCPQCRHVFEFDMEHRSHRKHVRFTCPECAYIGLLPPEDKDPVEAVIPGGKADGPTFLCGNCHEHWKVATIGHGPKKEIRFSACPHCGETEDFALLEDDRPDTPY